MSVILFDDQETRIVLLNRSFGNDGRDMKELRVRLTKEGAMFFHIAQDAAPKNYGLSTAEADAFVESWLAHRAEQKSKEQAEQERKQALIDESYAIAEKYPAIQIKETGPSCWRVSCPASGWMTAYPAQSAESLLRDAKSALDDYQRRLPYIKHMHLDTKATA